MELRGRNALVTGAGHRVGRAIALALAGRGMRVAIHYNSADKGARETLEQVRAAGGDGDVFPGDLTRGDAGDALVSAVREKFRTLDVLVNSAAVMVRTPFGETTAKQWDDIMALNLRAPFLLTQAAAPMLRASHGVVVNIADLAAFETWPAYVPHGISKSGVVHLTRSLARLLAPEVRVAAIAPGAVLLPENWDADSAEHLKETTPLHRMGSPEDVTRTVLFILDSDYLTGETIVVDGGRNVRR
jgi:pteridine reductase